MRSRRRWCLRPTWYLLDLRAESSDVVLSELTRRRELVRTNILSFYLPRALALSLLFFSVPFSFLFFFFFMISVYARSSLSSFCFSSSSSLPLAHAGMGDDFS